MTKLLTVAFAGLAGGLLWRVWWKRFSADQYISAVIKPPKYRYTGYDPALRERTEKRRVVADQIRRKAQAIESGTKTPELLRRVG